VIVKNSKSERGASRNVAAFFDIDGTLVAAPSLELRLAMRLAVRGELHAGAGARWLGRIFGAAMHAQIGEPTRMEMLDRNKAWMGGVDCSRVENAARAIAYCVPLTPIVLRRLREHAVDGHKIFLMSGTLAPIARALSERLATLAEMEICATELDSEGGTYSGGIAGAAMCGPEKASAVLRLAAKYKLDLAKSYAYANAIGDRWFLEAVGNPVVVAADRELAKLAGSHGWASLERVVPLKSAEGDSLHASEESLHEC